MNAPQTGILVKDQDEVAHLNALAIAQLGPAKAATVERKLKALLHLTSVRRLLWRCRPSAAPWPAPSPLSPEARRFAARETAGLHALLPLLAVLLSVAETSATAGTTAGTAGGNTIPASSRTRYVSSSTQLSNAISNALPGDHIVLTNGTYSGFTVSRSGQSGKPIVIRAANLHAAKFSGSISIAGSYVWVIGMNMGGRGISISGANNRVSRNTFKSSVVSAMVAHKTARNAEIDHNEHAGGTITSTSNNGASPIFMQFQCAEPSDHYVHHNYIHDGTGGDGISEAIMNGFGVVCDSRTKRPPDSGTLIEYNLISNWQAGYCLRTKAGKAIFRLNTCLGGGKGSQNRHGDNVQWIANWFGGNGAIRLFGSNHVVLGNRMAGTNDVLWIPAGNIYSTDDFETGYHAALNTVVAGNIGKLQIGGYFGNYNNVPAKNTRVEVHQTGNGCGQGSITCLKHTGTTFSATTNRTIPTAFKLSVSQVGPFAPTAPKL